MSIIEDYRSIGNYYKVVYFMTENSTQSTKNLQRLLGLFTFCRYVYVFLTIFVIYDLCIPVVTIP